MYCLNISAGSNNDSFGSFPTNDQVYHTVHISGIGLHNQDPVSRLIERTLILGIVSFGHPPDLVKSEREKFTLVLNNVNKLA